MSTETTAHPNERGSGTPEGELDPEALSTIRQMLAEDQHQTPGAARNGRRGVDMLQTAVPISAQTTRGEPKVSILDGPRRAIRGYRPKVWHIFVAVLLLVTLWSPWLIVGFAASIVFVALGLTLVLGTDGFWYRVMRLSQRYAKKNPRGAVRLRRRFNAVATRWDRVLDKFPEGKVDGLYLPDFEQMAAADNQREHTIDQRFSDLREG